MHFQRKLLKNVKFIPKEKTEFHKILRSRVNSYFKSRGLPKHGDWSLQLKAVIMFSFLWLPLIFVYTIPNIPWYGLVGTGLLIGIGQSGIGLSVMHDALHSSFFKSKKWNDRLGNLSMIFVGGYATNWKMQHNKLHHSYTNVHGVDLDIKPPSKLLRFSPYDELRGVHKFQYLYAWFLYSLMSLFWCFKKDFKDLYLFRSLGFYEGKDDQFKKEMGILIFHRIIYFGFWIVLPVVLTSYSLPQILLVFLFKHLFTGFVLAVVFQPAHVSEGSSFEELNVDSIEEDWAIHQMRTTVNFAMTNKFFSWYAGGLNFQIEHHLFPNISHIHYPSISRIVRETAQEFGVPYLSHPSFRSALKMHGKTLYELGRK